RLVFLNNIIYNKKKINPILPIDLNLSVVIVDILCLVYVETKVYDKNIKKIHKIKKNENIFY
ncbi:MAG: hypothetical protein PHI52_07495, partial [Bacteroidales bacterium]|nr:hypothetical protein [Bacteroidales bacterium]